MCGQLKSSHPSGCPSYGVSCSACDIVGHKLIFCRKVISLKKTTSSPPSRSNRPAKQRSDKKSKRKKKSADSSSEDYKIIKKAKKINFTKEVDYDSDPHVYISKLQKILTFRIIISYLFASNTSTSTSSSSS